MLTVLLFICLVQPLSHGSSQSTIMVMKENVDVVEVAVVMVVVAAIHAVIHAIGYGAVQVIVVAIIVAGIIAVLHAVVGGIILGEHLS